MPPKATKADKAAETEAQVITIRDTKAEKSYRLSTDDLGPADDLMARQQTGFPVSHFMDTFGADAFVVFIWMARRKSGEPNLSFHEVIKKYPTYKDLNSLEAEWEGEDQEEVDPLAEEDS